jgi:hypothetical protein
VRLRDLRVVLYTRKLTLGVVLDISHQALDYQLAPARESPRLGALAARGGLRSAIGTRDRGARPEVST